MSTVFSGYGMDDFVLVCDTCKTTVVSGSLGGGQAAPICSRDYHALARGMSWLRIPLRRDGSGLSVVS